jgi:hypothetical protein
MSQGNSGAAESRWGRVELAPENAGQQEEIRSPVSGAPLTGVIYRWVPPADWAGELPPDFDFSLRCVTVGGGRRFYPVKGVGGYLAEAYLGGLARLTRAMKLSAEQVFSYRAQSFFFQFLRARREHLRNRLDHPASLRLRRSAGGLAEVNSILPESVGQDGSGQGEPWSLNRLLDEGRKEALEQGVASPHGTDCVNFGLLRAARLNPLYVTDPDQVAVLVRMALYEMPDTPAPDAQTQEEVVARVLDALKRHLKKGVTAAQFAKWFMGPHNSLIGQVAKKGAPGGELDPSVVRRALFEQGWLAYRYMADCVQAMLHLFGRLLPEPLSASERRVFDRMHLKRPEFGDLPWFMLGERFAQLKTLLDEVWEAPDNREAVAVLHRLLAYHGEMACARRQADRQAKERKAGARREGQVLLDVQLPDESLPARPSGSTEVLDGLADGVPDELLPARPSESTEVLDGLADGVASDMGFSCGCENTTWTLRPDDLDEGSAVVYCRKCGKGERQVPLSLLRQLAQVDS